MKIAPAVIIAALVGGLVVAFWPREESPAKERSRHQREAELEFLSLYTNGVVGYQRTIRTRVSLHGHYSQWRAESEVEFINAIGGIERTNLPFDFSVEVDQNGVNRTRCHFDWKTCLARDQNMTRQELERRLSKP